MTRLNIITIVGARPQFIKASAVSRALIETGRVREEIVHTGQHYAPEMSQVFFDDLDIPHPAHNLNVGSGPHGEQTGRMLERIETVLLRERPDRIIVYGDTNSTIAGALAAAKLHLPIAHIEAGLRSHNRDMPEEVNRILTDHLSDLLFAPSAEAKQNLIKEGISEKQIKVVGDVMYDVALHYADRAKTRSSILSNLHLTAKGFVLATVHRAANTDDFSRLSKIIGGLTRIADHIPVIWPIHPRVRAILARIGQQNFPPTLRLVSPVGYLDMAMLEQNALVIVTDSGGVQKEAFFHHVRCVTLREETEWRELVEHNYNQLCPPTSETTIEETVTKALELSKTDMQDTTLPSWPQIYGNGGAATLIAAELLSAHH